MILNIQILGQYMKFKACCEIGGTPSPSTVFLQSDGLMNRFNNHAKKKFLFYWRKVEYLFDCYKARTAMPMRKNDSSSSRSSERAGSQAFLPFFFVYVD